ncbi:MAG: hypothetical protein QM709_15595 [Spongiibacteraceae bacterium]
MNRLFYSALLCVAALLLLHSLASEDNQPLREPDFLAQDSITFSATDQALTAPINSASNNTRATAKASFRVYDRKSLFVIAQENPELAAATAMSARLEQRLELLSIVADAWANKNFDAAWRWSATTNEYAFFLRQLLLKKLCVNDPQKAIALARQWSTEEHLQAADIFDSTIFSLTITRNYSMAAQLTQQSTSNETERDDTLRAVTYDWADDNPDQAAQWALQQQEQTQDIVLSAVVDRWINNAPIGAAEFVKSLPDSPRKTELLKEVCSRWIAMDESNAKIWIAANQSMIQLNPHEL